MARTTSFSQVLWLMTTVWLAACGRLGFDSGDDGLGNKLPDAAVAKDAPVADAQPVGPKIATGAPPTMTAMCGQLAAVFKYPLSNPGDQDLVITSAEIASDQGSGAATFTVISQLPLTIPAGGIAAIEVRPPDSVVGTDRAKTVKTATLTLATNAPGSESFPIKLSSTVTGANIDVAVLPAGLTMSFNGTSGMCPTATKTLRVVNSGTIAASVTIDGGSGSGMAAAYTSGFTGGSVAAGVTQTTVYRAFSTGECSRSGTLTVSAGGASGIGVCTDDVTVTVNFVITGASSACPSCS